MPPRSFDPPALPRSCENRLHESEMPRFCEPLRAPSFVVGRAPSFAVERSPAFILEAGPCSEFEREPSVIPRLESLRCEPFIALWPCAPPRWAPRSVLKRCHDEVGALVRAESRLPRVSLPRVISLLRDTGALLRPESPRIACDTERC